MLINLTTGRPLCIGLYFLGPVICKTSATVLIFQFTLRSRWPHRLPDQATRSPMKSLGTPCPVMTVAAPWPHHQATRSPMTSLGSPCPMMTVGSPWPTGSPMRSWIWKYRKIPRYLLHRTDGEDHGVEGQRSIPEQRRRQAPLDGPGKNLPQKALSKGRRPIQNTAGVLTGHDKTGRCRGRHGGWSKGFRFSQKVRLILRAKWTGRVGRSFRTEFGSKRVSQRETRVNSKPPAR